MFWLLSSRVEVNMCPRCVLVPAGPSVWVVARVSCSHKMLREVEEQQEGWGSGLVHVGIVWGALKIDGVAKWGTTHWGLGGQEGSGDKMGTRGLLVVMDVISVPAVVEDAGTYIHVTQLCRTHTHKHTHVQNWKSEQDWCIGAMLVLVVIPYCRFSRCYCQGQGDMGTLDYFLQLPVNL